MILQGWIIGWMIQLAVALVLWLPLSLFSGWPGSWDRAWAFGAKVRTGFWLLVLIFIGGTLLLGQVQNSAPTRSNRIPSSAIGEPSNSASIQKPSDPALVHVYDYTTRNPWTALVISTVAEFNAVRPPEAPRLVYVTASGDAECLDITNDEVWKLSGIIVCDTLRAEDFPYDPDAPVEGWAGVTREMDGDTVQIALNNFVPEGYYHDTDNTVCHEMMHAYLRVDDNYDSDANSCVFGNLLSPGPTDIRLMWERWPAAGQEPTGPEPVSEVIPDGGLDIPDLRVNFPGIDVGLPGDEPGRLPPTIEPTVTPPRSRPTAVLTASARSGCDPAYPDHETCIPPGPPLEFPCAITDERNFTVLPPDPRGLDRDGDGIGCEPVASN